MAAYFTKDQWFALPIELRRLWWRETDYGRRPPSIEVHTRLLMFLRYKNCEGMI